MGSYSTFSSRVRASIILGVLAPWRFSSYSYLNATGDPEDDEEEEEEKKKPEEDDEEEDNEGEEKEVPWQVHPKAEGRRQKEG